MSINRDISSAKVGMNTDKATFDLSKNEYSFALNANFHDEHGSGKVNLQNEPSNILCSGFKEGYKVIGHKYHLALDRTYFFLVNPETGCSEIGYISTLQNFEGIQPVENCNSCSIEVTLENPLEDTTQTATCQYITLITDECEGDCLNPCLNFSVDNPIHESNVVIKEEKTGTNMYFNVEGSPRRYLQLDNIDIYTNSIDPCTGDVTETCLQCDRLRVDQLFTKPCIEVNNLQNGGNLRAGTYEILVAYATSNGDAISNYYSKTNPIAIHDRNNNILDQTNLDYITNKAISITVFDLDNSYDFYNVAVIYKSGLDTASRVFNYGTYPIGTDTITISSLTDKQTLSLSDIFSRKPFYTSSKGLATGNGYLFHYGMEAQREINLQPVVNLMGAFVKWNTVAAKESLYLDGSDVAKYRGYMRDEVYPLSIRFFGEGGYETPRYPFIARPAESDELEILGTAGFPEDTNTNSINEFVYECQDISRDKRWQYENTASVEGTCLQYSNSDATVIEIVEELDCFVTDASDNLTVVDTIASGTLQIDLGGSNLATYINQNSSDIIAGSDPQFAAIKDIIEDPSEYPNSCTPEFPGNCGTATLKSEEILALETSTEVITNQPADFDSYNRTEPPSSCIATGVQDTDFRDEFLIPSATVLQRNTPSNVSCSGAVELVEVFNTPTSQIDNPFTLGYEGSIGTSSPLLTPFGTSATDTDFSSFVHTNAVWYKVTFGGAPYIAVEVSTITADTTDSLDTDRIRLSFYNSCSDTSSVGAYSRVISDITLSNDPDKYVVLDASDFPSGEALIAIDGPIEEEIGFDIVLSDPTIELTLSGSSGTSNVIVNGTNYLATFNTDLDTTASDFVSTHSADILTNENVTVTSSLGGILNFSGPGISTISVSGVTGDLGGSESNGEIEITIDGNTYSQQYNTDLDTTASDFVSTHSADLLSNSDIPVISIGDTLRFRATATQYATLVIGAQGITGTDSGSQSYFYLRTPAGCTNIHKRAVETTPIVDFTGLTFGKKQVYTSTCSTSIPKGLDCEPIPFQYGKFGYWESAIKYPCNQELYDSSSLIINRDDLPESIQQDFEDYYVDSTQVGGVYNLNDETNFMDRGIRHYRFPCSITSPFMSSENPGQFSESTIFPIGFSIDPEIVRRFLDIAASNGLISIDERSRLTRYEIFRGDRTTDKSIVAKGLLFDTYEYNERNGDKAYYANYPLNTLGRDRFNGFINHRGDSKNNTEFMFHSPDTHFNKPTLPNEMKVEGYLYGASAKYWDEVKDHALFTILGDKSINAATAIATAEVVLDIVTKIADWVVLGTTGGISSIAGVIAAVAAGVAHGIAAVIEIGAKRYEWIETIRNLGQPKNHAYYNATIGHYNYMITNKESDSIYRGLPVTQYLGDGRWSVPDETQSNLTFNINNVDREESVFLSVGLNSGFEVNYPEFYSNYDVFGLSGTSRDGYTGVGRSGRIVGKAASPYVSLKQYLPEQYGSLESIDWIPTGYCGNINNITDCDPIFGGDIFISRFSVKRKFPMFTTTAHGLAPLTPFKYSDYFNVNPESTFGRFFVNYRINKDSDSVTFAGVIFPSDQSEYQLDNLTNSDVWYIEPPSKFYLYFYGFPHFLVESPINCNFRYAGREFHENFYPNFQDVIKYTQESDISIREPNTFFYNDVYSLTPTRVAGRILPSNYNRELYDRLNNLTNTTIYSLQDSSEQDLTDPWLVYRPLDSYQFPTSYGQLVDMDGIESEQILGRFEHGLTIFGAFDQLRDRQTAETGTLGSGGIFSGRNVNFNKTDLGYAGTQHISKVSCEFGHFWPDVKRGEVFRLHPNGKGLEQITEGKEKWFKEHLPFKISKYISGIEREDLDNAYKGLGISMGWDARLKRVFLTKKDYKPRVEGVTYIDKKFFYDGEEVNLTNTDIFEDCSFTLAYSPLSGTWISYYSFLPNYYIDYENYFQTGINNSEDPSEIGLWSHYSFLSSYQVFYGKLHPFTVEGVMPTKFTNSTVHDVEYWLDVRKYYNKYDYSDIVGVGFDEAYVYNSYQNTGRLLLTMQKCNDMTQILNYPKHNSDSIDILQSEIAGKFSFNYLYSSVRNEKSGIPHWNFDCSQVNKTLVNSQFDYRSTYKDRLRGDYFTIRLSNNSESRYKMIYRFLAEKRDFIEN